MTALDIRKYINNTLRILATDKYLELEKVLTNRSDKHEINQNEKQSFRFDITASIIAHNDKNEHSHYSAFIPLVYTEDKPETIEHFLKKYEQNPQYPANIIPYTYAGTWEARYEYSLNFIFRFLGSFHNLAPNLPYLRNRDKDNLQDKPDQGSLFGSKKPDGNNKLPLHLRELCE